MPADWSSAWCPRYRPASCDTWLRPSCHLGGGDGTGLESRSTDRGHALKVTTPAGGSWGNLAPDTTGPGIWSCKRTILLVCMYVNPIWIKPKNTFLNPYGFSYILYILSLHSLQIQSKSLKLNKYHRSILEWYHTPWRKYSISVRAQSFNIRLNVAGEACGLVSSVFPPIVDTVYVLHGWVRHRYRFEVSEKLVKHCSHTNKRNSKTWGVNLLSCKGIAPAYFHKIYAKGGMNEALLKQQSYHPHIRCWASFHPIIFKTSYCPTVMGWTSWVLLVWIKAMWGKLPKSPLLNGASNKYDLASEA